MNITEKLETIVGLPKANAAAIGAALDAGRVIVCRESDYANTNGYHGAQFYRLKDGTLHTARKNYPDNEMYADRWRPVSDHALASNAQVRYELAHVYKATEELGNHVIVAQDNMEMWATDGFGTGDIHFDHDPKDLA